ncbi:hypothetical protein BN903_27 [Halorubrum sp. AJ67]|nr:hypothetical protein BN903_27 [Halorubrum sp. AJ67]
MRLRSDGTRRGSCRRRSRRLPNNLRFSRWGFGSLGNNVGFVVASDAGSIILQFSRRNRRQQQH